MSPSKFSSSLLIHISCLFLVASTISAHNITRILEKYPDFKTFNELLTRTNLAAQINSRKTITVLAIPDDNIGDLASRPEDVMKDILMSHVVLDYYDILKLQKMKGKSSILTTMYQTTGTASYQQGFLNVTEDKATEQVVFGSAVNGAQHNVHYIGTVATIPYNISVLSVSGPIVAPGIGGQTLRPIASPPKRAPSPKLPPSPTPAPAPAPAPEADSPADAPDADSPDADSPAPSDDSDSPSDAPASSPSADAPDADAAVDNSKSLAVKHLASDSLALLLAFASFLFAY